MTFLGQSANFVEESNTNCTKLLHCYYFGMTNFAMILIVKSSIPAKKIENDILKTKWELC